MTFRLTAPPTSMTLRRLDWALRAGGTDLAEWPAADRLAAVALLRTSRAARTLLADALALDDTRPDQLSDTLADPVALARMQGVLRGCMARPSPILSGIRWGALAACTVAGLYFGMAGSAAVDGDAFATVQSLTVASAL
jgi:hypothetical protein